MQVLEFTKKIENIQKLDTELRTLNTKYESLTIKDEYLQLMFTGSLVQEEINAISNLITNFVEIDATEQLRIYIETKVRPFIEDMTYQLKAENVMMGITQLGKTVEVLGFFNERIVPEGRTRAVSLKEALSDDSLYAVVEVLNYWILNTEEYSDLSPFITQAKLEELRAKIIAFLGA